MPYFLHFTASKCNRIGRHGGLPCNKLLQPCNGLGVAVEVQYDVVGQFESGLSLSTKKPSLLFAGRFFYFPCFTLHAAGRTRGKSINDHASMPPERLITRQSLSVSASATSELLPPDLQ